MVWSIFRYIEPFRCDSRVWRTDRHQLTDTLTANAALHCVAQQKMLREVRGLFIRANMLALRFGLCSVAVKIVLFKSLCVRFVVWSYGTVIHLLQLIDCDLQCVREKATKMFLVISQKKLGRFSWNLMHGFLNKFAVKTMWTFSTSPK